MISHLNRMVSDFALDGYRFYDFITHFKQDGRIEKLTRPILTELVDTILVHEDGNITINFKFKDAYEQVIEYIEETKQKYLEEIA